MSRPIVGIVRKYFQFCLVGGSGLIVDMAIVLILHSLVGLNIIVAKIVAAELALLNNFIWNEYWTFRGGDVSPGSRRVRLLRFHAVCVMGIGLALGILIILHQRLGWSVELANGTAIVLASLWNFFLSWIWGWRTPSAKEGQPKCETR